MMETSARNSIDVDEIAKILFGNLQRQQKEKLKNSKTKTATLLSEPYDPDAQDGDGDGIVQDGTAWERPAGTRLLGADNREIERGTRSDIRPQGLKVIDNDGNEIAYTPRSERTQQNTIGAGVDATTLEDLGLPTVSDRSTAEAARKRRTSVFPAEDRRQLGADLTHRYMMGLQRHVESSADESWREVQITQSDGTEISVRRSVAPPGSRQLKEGDIKMAIGHDIAELMLQDGISENDLFDFLRAGARSAVLSFPESGDSGQRELGIGQRLLAPDEVAISRTTGEVVVSNIFEPEQMLLIPKSDSNYKQLLGEKAVRHMVSFWASSANDRQPWSLALQELAAEYFGLDGFMPWQMNTAMRSTVNQIKKDFEPILKSFLYSQYESTQRFFRNNDITQLAVYRGMEIDHNWDDLNSGGILLHILQGMEDQTLEETGRLEGWQVGLRPLSSWAVDVGQAEYFQGDTGRWVRLETVVPVSRILSTAGTGVGCWDEREVVLIGGTAKSDIEYSAQNMSGAWSAAREEITRIRSRPSFPSWFDEAYEFTIDEGDDFRYLGVRDRLTGNMFLVAAWDSNGQRMYGRDAPHPIDIDLDIDEATATTEDWEEALGLDPNPRQNIVRGLMKIAGAMGSSHKWNYSERELADMFAVDDLRDIPLQIYGPLGGGWVPVNSLLKASDLSQLEDDEVTHFLGVSLAKALKQTLEKAFYDRINENNWFGREGDEWFPGSLSGKERGVIVEFEDSAAATAGVFVISVSIRDVESGKKDQRAALILDGTDASRRTLEMTVFKGELKLSETVATVPLDAILDDPEGIERLKRWISEYLRSDNSEFPFGVGGSSPIPNTLQVSATPRKASGARLHPSQMLESTSFAAFLDENITAPEDAPYDWEREEYFDAAREMLPAAFDLRASTAQVLRALSNAANEFIIENGGELTPEIQNMIEYLNDVMRARMQWREAHQRDFERIHAELFKRHTAFIESAKHSVKENKRLQKSLSENDFEILLEQWEYTQKVRFAYDLSDTAKDFFDRLLVGESEGERLIDDSTKSVGRGIKDITVIEGSDPDGLIARVIEDMGMLVAASSQDGWIRKRKNNFKSRIFIRQAEAGEVTGGFFRADAIDPFIELIAHPPFAGETPGQQRARLSASLIHEIGHRLDHVVVKDKDGKLHGVSSYVTQGLLNGNPQVVALFKAIRKWDWWQATHEWWSKQPGAPYPGGASGENAAFFNYLSSPQEIWARLTALWTAYRTGRVDVLDYLYQNLAAGAEFPLDEYFIDVVVPLMEDLLESRNMLISRSPQKGKAKS